MSCVRLPGRTKWKASCSSLQLNQDKIKSNTVNCGDDTRHSYPQSRGQEHPWSDKDDGWLSLPCCSIVYKGLLKKYVKNLDRQFRRCCVAKQASFLAKYFHSLCKRDSCLCCPSGAQPFRCCQSNIDRGVPPSTTQIFPGFFFPL